jgi:hypothetical protein
VYLNAKIAWQIFLTLPVTIESCEHSFGKLNLWSAQTQKHASNLAIISVKEEQTQQLNCGNTTDKFANAKARKFLDKCNYSWKLPCIYVLQCTKGPSFPAVRQRRKRTMTTTTTTKTTSDNFMNHLLQITVFVLWTHMLTHLHVIVVTSISCHKLEYCDAVSFPVRRKNKVQSLCLKIKVNTSISILLHWYKSSRSVKETNNMWSCGSYVLE